MKFIKNYFKKWNVFEIAFGIFATISFIVLTIVVRGWWVECVAGVLTIFWCLLLAKGKVEGYIVGFVATALYAWIAVTYSYYGELIISVAIATPMNVFGLVQWLRHRRTDKKKGEVVVVNRVKPLEYVLLIASQAVLAVGYYYLLRAFNTEFLIVSTIAICTNVVGTYLLLRRDLFNTVAWLADCIVQVVLWGYLAFTVGWETFAMLWMTILVLVNNVYGIVNWFRLKKGQENEK